MPRRQLSVRRWRRWSSNIGLIVISNILIRLCVPILATGVAAFADHKGLGIFNILSLPLLLNIVLSVVLLDMLIYWQHVASHHFSFLWVFHKVHHCDRDIDVTTGVRFHPVEMVLSIAYKFLCILLIGPAVWAVVIFEIVLNASAMFNHANIRLPLKLDNLLRKFVVTPDMHRLHHSVVTAETNSNFGFNLSLWDRLFSTYTAQPKQGHVSMTIGLSEYQDQKPASIWWCLALPFNLKNKMVFVANVFLIVFMSILMISRSINLGSVHSYVKWRYPDISHIDLNAADILDNAVYFDVRELDEFGVSHISGAIQVAPSISNEEFLQRFDDLLKGKTLIFYCSVGKRSSALVDRLQHQLKFLGYTSVYNLRGGIFGWHNSGRAVEDGEGVVEKIHPYSRVWSRLIHDQKSIAFYPST